MLFESKEEQDMYMGQAIKNLICDEASFNMKKREPFHSWHEIFGFLFEEFKELEEAQEKLQDEYVEYLHLIMVDARAEDVVKRLELLRNEVHNVVHEAIHVGAVALKGIRQMEERSNGKERK